MIGKGQLLELNTYNYCSVKLSMYSHPQVLPRGVIRPGVGVAAGGGEALVAEGLLDEVGRGAAVEGVRGVGMPEPVRGDVFFDAGVAGSLAYDPPELAAAKRPVGLLRAKHRIAWRPEARTHFLVAERDKHIPRRGGKENGARLFALALKGDLARDLALSGCYAPAGRASVDPRLRRRGRRSRRRGGGARGCGDRTPGR